MSVSKQLKNETIIYWIGVILLSIWFGGSGFMEITKNPLVWDRTLQMGYPSIFIYSLGLAKVIGVFVLVIPNKLGWLKEWVFAAFFFDVIFAGISGYSFAGISEITKPVIAFVLILSTYVVFRKINPVLSGPFN